MSTRPFIIYKSSAGSGKTYTLTMEYLKLALKSPISFKSILAVTFTNKATQEMKERIIKELKRLKSKVDSTNKMDQEIMSALQIGADELMLRASQTLTTILHNYGRFSVSTIDSFFQKVVRAFAREMDLNAKFEVELDQDAVLDQVVDRLVMQVMDDEDLHRWLVSYAIEEIQEGKSWDIRNKIKDLGRQIFQEDFKKYAPEIRAFLKDKKNIESLKGFVFAQRQEIIKIATTLKEQANQIRISNALDWTDFSGGSRSFALKFDKLGDKNQPIPELSPTQITLPENVDKWYSKSSKKIAQIETAYHQGLGQVLAQFASLTIKWNTLTAISKNLSVFGVFKHLLDELTMIKDEENILLISDANEFLKEITKSHDAPFIYEKVGNQFNHYLIDEFQDTSGFQWASFKPLLENTLAQGHTNLLVGDVKQSIYRWRGGEMKLLLHQVEDEMGKDNVSNKNLDTNFRSLPNIVNFNNAIFNMLPEAFAAAVEDRYGAEKAEIIPLAYEDVQQHVPQHKLSEGFQGKVKWEFLVIDKEDEEEGNFEEQALNRLPDMVIHLQEVGYRLQDIAFLVRTKRQGERIADTMMQYAMDHPDTGYRFDVLSDESMFLTKSAAVKALVAGLKYLQDSEDLIQFKTMWYFKVVIDGHEVDHQLFKVNETPRFLDTEVQQFKNQYQYLLQLPLMEVVEELIVLLGLQVSGLELAYLGAFKDAVYDYVSKNRADLSGFLSWWDEQRTKRTVKIPEGHDAMRILTIHKSKGLQFKVVLMPFLNWEIFDTRKANVVWAPFQIAQQPEPIVVPLSLSSQLAQSDFSEVFAEEAVMAYLDSLNMVYVALTRAEEVFWALSSWDKKGENVNKLEVHFQQIFKAPSNTFWKSLGAGKFEESDFCFELGDWPNAVLQKEPEPSTSKLRWSYQQWHHLLKVKKYAVDFSQDGIDQRKKRDFGLLIHEILEKSRDYEEMMSHLQGLMFEGRISEVEKGGIELQLNGLFENTLFKSWFGTGAVFLPEQGILLPGGKQRRPDRVILEGENAIVVDFKTGEKRSSYEKQVKEYVNLVAELTSLETVGYLCYLESGEIVKVI
ncbi:UvrD-helicase domain-containing protein [Belliella sp. DSM 111904]|uniref:DNA 3'-5' helicase n=1 Tax=Belliella filtrata TaxID=2923435 RepID=A0ABS9V1R5_9BACT|nr:UvrD-helicase domain-containing protein [Belliella filtrata]MCH7410357.1 UvrD-helicase domain-containing protein [Belliella filtrata]